MAHIDIIACRHSFTNSTEAAGSDQARTLTKEGYDKAEVLGQKLNDIGIFPDVALVTTALRTYETAIAVTANAVQTVEIQYGYPGQPDFSTAVEEEIMREYAHVCALAGHSDVSFNELIASGQATRDWMRFYDISLTKVVKSLIDEGRTTIAVFGHGPVAIGAFVNRGHAVLGERCPPCTAVHIKIDASTLNMISATKIA